jgi:hypothetical protein
MKYIGLFGFYMVVLSFAFDLSLGKTKFSDLMAVSGSMMVVSYAATKTLKNHKV